MSRRRIEQAIETCDRCGLEMTIDTTKPNAWTAIAAWRELTFRLVEDPDESDGRFELCGGCAAEVRNMLAPLPKAESDVVIIHHRGVP